MFRSICHLLFERGHYMHKHAPQSYYVSNISICLVTFKTPTISPLNPNHYCMYYSLPTW